MLMWAFLLVCDLLIPITMLAFGAVFRFRPPTEINEYYGYRTRRSTQSPAAWEYAHRFFGLLWLILGAVMLPVVLAAFILMLGEPTQTVETVGTMLCFGGCFVMLLPIIPTELRLKRIFG